MSNKNRLNKLKIKDSGLIFDSESGQIFVTNEIGLTIIDGLTKNMSKAEIKSLLESKYLILDGKLDKDLFDFYYQLKSYGLLEEI